VTALNHIIGSGLCFSRHLADAEPTNIILTARAHQNMIKVSQAHWTAILVNIEVVLVKVVYKFELLLAD